MRREEKNKQIVLETYNLLFQAAEPSLDFINYINTTCNYIEADTNKKVIKESHLSEEEQRAAKLMIDVPFEEHFISKVESEKIIESQVKKYKLSKYDAEKLRTQVYLGCAPAFKD